MKRLFLLIIIVLSSILSFGQGVFVDSLGHFRVDNRIITGDIRLNLNNPSTALATSVSISGNDNYFEYLPMTLVTSLTKQDGSPYVSVIEFEQALGSVLTVSQDVNIQDQTTPLIVAKMSKEIASTTMATLGAIDDRSFDVADATGFVAGQYLSIFSVPDNRFYLANVLDVTSVTITVDTPLDFAFPIGSFVTVGTTNMNVDGSVTPQIFGLRNTEQAIGSAFDITRIIFKCLTATAVDLSKFGDLTALTRGIVFRKKDGIYMNVFNAKSNADLKSLMFDFDIETTIGQQQDGFTGRMTFAGQNKMGVAIRLKPGEDIQMIIQDVLTGLVLFEVICEGHTVE